METVYEVTHWFGKRFWEEQRGKVVRSVFLKKPMRNWTRGSWERGRRGGHRVDVGVGEVACSGGGRLVTREQELVE